MPWVMRPVPERDRAVVLTSSPPNGLPGCSGDDYHSNSAINLLAVGAHTLRAPSRGLDAATAHITLAEGPRTLPVCRRMQGPARPGQRCAAAFPARTGWR